MIISHDVTFNENEMHHSLKKWLNVNKDNKKAISIVELEVEPLQVESKIKNIKTERQLQEPNFTEEEESVDEYIIARYKPRRVTRLLVRFSLNGIVSFALTIAKDIMDSEPRNYKEAMRSKESVERSESMEEEMNFLKKNKLGCW